MLIKLCPMRHILCWSGGEDSTATAILAHEHGLPLDTIVFSEVMYDRYRGISGEHPRHIDFIKNVATPVFEKWGYEVVILHAEYDFIDFFNHTIDRPVKHMEHKGKKYGFPISKLCGIKRECKVKPLNAYLAGMEGEFAKYLGICADEPLRLMSLERQKNTVSLLQELGYTKAMAGALCESYGLRSPVYRLSNPNSVKRQKRQGCWFCPNAQVCEHLLIKKEMPEIWKEYVALENEDIAFDKWNAFAGETLHERNQRMDNILNPNYNII